MCAKFSESLAWDQLLESETQKDYFIKLTALVETAYQLHEVYPPKALVLNATKLCPFDKVKVVLLGQDPYHRSGQANGLSFSVNPGVAIPPSLKNIFKELTTDIPGFKIPESGNLEAWALQGVLLLNSVLTVEAGLPGSHKNFGWQTFTDHIISSISTQRDHVVFLLWGNYAKTKAGLIDAGKHLVLEAAHPSPLARGAFFGCRHFSKTNNYLVKHHIDPIIWNLP